MPQHLISVGIAAVRTNYGGERGIRTPGPRKGSAVFETAPFNRSGISPKPIYGNVQIRVRDFVRVINVQIP